MAVKYPYRFTILDERNSDVNITEFCTLFDSSKQEVDCSFESGPTPGESHPEAYFHNDDDSYSKPSVWGVYYILYNNEYYIYDESLTTETYIGGCKLLTIYLSDLQKEVTIPGVPSISSFQIGSSIHPIDAVSVCGKTMDILTDNEIDELWDEIMVDKEFGG